MIDIPAGTIERVSAVVVVPLDYYRNELAKSLPEGQQPDQQQVLARANADKERIRDIVLKALGPKAKAEDVTVDTRYVPTEPAAVVAAASAGGGSVGPVVERYGPTAVLVGLSMAFILLLGRWVKRPGAGEVAQVAVPAAGGSDEEPILLPADGEQSPEAKRQAEMRRRIEEMVKQDPGNAANLVLRWLNQG